MVLVNKIKIKCEVDGCNHETLLFENSIVNNIKRNGKYICMSCIKNKCWTCKLSQSETNIILGSLLGDACILKGPTKNYNTALIAFEHSYKQKSLIDWKFSRLSRLANGEPHIRNNRGYGTKNIRFSTKCHSCFYPIYDIVIKNGVKTVSQEWLNSINHPISLAVWYMDDGTIDERGSCILCTDGFAKSEVETICDWLQKNWAIDGLPILKNSKYWRIRLSKTGRDVFLNTIEEFVDDSMDYKLKTPVLTRNFIQESVILEAISLRTKGESYCSIGKKLGYSHAGISKAIKRFENGSYY